MSAVLLAIFRDFGSAEGTRTAMVRDGFPTDRVELTAHEEMGRAGVQPAHSEQQQFLQYFRTLFNADSERAIAESLAERVTAGEVSTVAIHPRGERETKRALEILGDRRACEVLAHELDKQAFEFAAAPTRSSWVGHLLPEGLDRNRSFFALLPEELQGNEPGRPS